jgi:cell wall-associated NlpC family hydrolase
MKTRAEAVEIARSWIGTPYVLGGRIKGAGVDCAMLLAEYLIEIGAATRDEEQRDPVPVYAADWFHHTTEERYKFRLLRHAQEIAEAICIGTPAARPGDLVLFRVAESRVFNHGAIVTAWPRGIHALEERVQEVDLANHAVMAHRAMAVFSPWKEDHASR